MVRTMKNIVLVLKIEFQLEEMETENLERSKIGLVHLRSSGLALVREPQVEF